MQRIMKRLRQSEERGIFHDSRKDARLFAQMINLCIDKINELQEEVENLQNERKQTTDNAL